MMRKGRLVWCIVLFLMGSSTIVAGCSNRKQVQEETSQVEIQTNYTFYYNSRAINLNEDIEDVIKKIGEPMDYFEAPSCAFEGYDKIYYYGGFEIHTYEREGRDYILNIFITDDSVTTNEGVYIGQGKEEILAIYGDDYSNETSDVQYEYGTEDMKLIFLFDNDTLISIEYRYVV